MTPDERKNQLALLEREPRGDAANIVATFAEAWADCLNEIIDDLIDVGEYQLADKVRNRALEWGFELDDSSSVITGIPK